MGLTDQELQEQTAKGHPYEFNMGHGHFIPLNNHGEAAKALMERNFPDILHDRQNKAVFIPESHLATMPRVVDIPRYNQTKRKIDEQAKLEGPAVLEQLGMKPGAPVEVTQAKGDLAEKELAEELKKFLDGSTDKEVVVFHGPEIRVPGKGKGHKQENDIVIINKRIKAVFVIESKTTLTEKIGGQAVEQTRRLKEILQEFFATEFASKEWCLVSMIFTNTIKTKKPFCSVCSE